MNTGAGYDPATDTWVPTSTGEGAPSPRALHTAVWTGDEIVVWGGVPDYGTGTGARYDPVTRAWQPTSTIGAPRWREYHRAEWLGSKMIVWGGQAYDYLDTGGVYEPATDSWQATTTVGAPQPRSRFTAVNAEGDFLVWGGSFYDGSTTIVFGDGFRYDVASDVWSPISLVDAPSARSYHTAVTTGDEMIIYGGYGAGGHSWMGAGTPTTSTTGNRSQSTGLRRVEDNAMEPVVG